MRSAVSPLCTASLSCSSFTCHACPRRRPKQSCCWQQAGGDDGGLPSEFYGERVQLLHVLVAVSRVHAQSWCLVLNCARTKLVWSGTAVRAPIRNPFSVFAGVCRLLSPCHVECRTRNCTLYRHLLEIGFFQPAERQFSAGATMIVAPCTTEL